MTKTNVPISRGATEYPQPRVESAPADGTLDMAINKNIEPCKGVVRMFERVNIALSGLIASYYPSTQGSATLHPGLRVLRPFGTKGHVTLAAPTSKMKEEAIGLGYYNAAAYGPEYPKLQILTIEGLMSGAERPRFPDPFDKLRASLTLGRSTFKRAAVEDVGGEQGKLL